MRPKKVCFFHLLDSLNSNWLSGKSNLAHSAEESRMAWETARANHSLGFLCRIGVPCFPSFVLTRHAVC